MHDSHAPAPVPHIQRVGIRDFPFQQAILLEECHCYDADVLQQYYKGSAIFLLATVTRTYLTDVLEEGPGAEGSLTGFLVSDVGRDEDLEVYGVLKNLAVSCAEDSPEIIRAALIRRWQEECRQELWDGLRASVSPVQEADRAAFFQECFSSLGTCPCCESELLQWRSDAEQPRAL
ncbi:hypothetical protein HYS30_01010 [Candidatus Peregrinibacteria bacterium]|nr:hypothetical protein [Candidatus Peregrinibacteria bacterium]